MIDDSLIVILVICLVGYILVAPALGLRALLLVRHAHRDLRLLRSELEVLRQQIAGPRRAPGAPAPEPTPEPRVAPQPEAAAPAVPAAPVESARPETSTAEAPTSRPSPLPRSPRRPAAARAGHFEESLTSRWLVWLGAVTIALAGTFLVKYSIEQGWLGPTVRVSLGLLLGALLIAGGEALRRRPLARALAAVRPDYVPPALTAAGLFTAFASGYAAYGLYGLIAPASAFLLLAGLAGVAVALALLQGPLIALLGLLGGYATPLLVQTGTPAPWPLFGFLLALTAAALAVVHLRSWWWLGWAALAGSTLWPLLWFTAAWGAEDSLPLGLYLLLLSGLFLVPAARPSAEALPDAAALGPPRWFAAFGPADRLVWGAAGALAVVVFAYVRMDAYGTLSLAVLALLVALHLGLGWCSARFDGLPPIASLLCLAVFATWHLPAILPPPPSLYVIAGRGYGSIPAPLLPPELAPFSLAACGFAALFGLGGLLALLRGARRPGLFAAVSAATPLYLMAVAYWRFRNFELDFAWAAVSLGLGGLALAAASWVGRERARPGFGAALGAYAAAVVAATGLAATMSLEQAWLTVALALQIPALAWVQSRTDAPALRPVAGIVAAIVLIRLALNPFVLDYPLGSVPALNWMLYGYGIPVIAFLLGARIFRRARADSVVTLLEAGALVFFVLLVSLEIRNLVTGPITAVSYPLAERSLNAIAWLAIALGLERVAARGGQGASNPVALWGWRLLAGLATAQVILLQAFGANPLFTLEPIEGPVLFNIMTLAYLAPAGFAFVFARRFRHSGPNRLAAAAGLIGLGLVWLDLSLEVRHVFHGTYLALGATGDGELYSYSLLWLGLAGGLLALALRSGSASLRYVSLAVLMLTTAKVFLIDMGSLTGLFRVASFLGLGLCLIGIGYLYQRYVFPPARAPKGEEK